MAEGIARNPRTCLFGLAVIYVLLSHFIGTFMFLFTSSQVANFAFILLLVKVKDLINLAGSGDNSCFRKVGRVPRDYSESREAVKGIGFTEGSIPV